jgi:translation initiation factor IF-3
MPRAASYAGGQKAFSKEIQISKELRTNERIKAREVRVIDDTGAQLGVMSLREALDKARERNVDLVEVAPTASPPVCRLLDYGKFRYEQTKKEREARRNQKIVSLKEVRLRPKIDDHDLATKGKTAQKFLEEGDKVKLTVMFRGRELAHTDIGRDILDKVAEHLREIGNIDQPPKMEGKSMTMLVSPSHKKAVHA